MPVFTYIALDGSGRKWRGERQAPTEAALEEALERQGQWLTWVKARAVDHGIGNRRLRWQTKAPRRLVMEFFLQLGMQLKAGVPVVSALSLGANECEHLGFRAVQKDLLDRVQAGDALSEAMGEYPKIFSPLVINLVQAGETSGRLPETCRELHLYFEWLDRLVADVRQALIYPGMVLLSTMGFVFLLFGFLMPRFAALLTELNAPLPWLTQVIMGVSDFAHGHWWWMACIALASWVTLVLLPRWFPAIAFAVDRLKLSLPMVGELNRLIGLSRLAHNLAVLYRSGIPLLEALRLCRGVVGNQVLSRAVAKMESGVNEGIPMHEVMARQSVFSGLILQMVSVGENTGQLGEALQNVADYYNDVIPRQIKRMFAIFEPALILFLIVLVGAVAFSVFLPISNLLGAR